MTLRAGILGASGYGGAELLRRLLRHPEVVLTGIASRQYLGQAVAACWPQFAGSSPLKFQTVDEVIANCDVLFCATPHAQTAPLAHKARAAGLQVVDLSADFRLSPADYALWYGEHPFPELCAEAVYGLVEIHRHELPGAQLIAVPGCNCTAANLALSPLAAAGLLGEETIINVITGVSGAGRALSQGFHFAEMNENAKAYKVAGAHRHTAEIEDNLGRLLHFGKEVKTRGDYPKIVVSLTPHVVPMTRGIAATCVTRPSAKDNLSTEKLLELYRDFYAADEMVSVQDDIPETKAVSASDRTLLSVRLDARSGLISAFAVLDNLGKGAAGQAVQAFNVSRGFAETTGLCLQGVWP